MTGFFGRSCRARLAAIGGALGLALLFPAPATAFDTGHHADDKNRAIIRLYVTERAIKWLKGRS